MSLKYQTKGAKIMNSVLSGNLPNMFDIYNVGQLINVAQNKNPSQNGDDIVDENGD